MIRFESIRKKGCINNVSFTLEKGRACVLSERESDAFAIITAACGLNVPDFGTVDKSGDVRFIAKNAPLPSYLTVTKYLDLIRDITKSTVTPDITLKIETEYGNRVIGTLDSLDRYRVALSSALIGSPAAIAVSDPFHGVTYEQRESLNEYLDKISEGTPIIYNSYFPSLCRKSDQVIVLSAGRCVGNGSANEIFNLESPTLVCRVKGSIDKLDLSLLGEKHDVTPVDNGMYDITFSCDGNELRENVKEAIASSGMALLSVKGEHDELKRVIAALDKLESEEADKLSASEEPQKLSADSLSISGEDEPENKSPQKTNKLKIIGFYSDEAEEDGIDDEKSTLFSDEGSDEE